MEPANEVEKFNEYHSLLFAIAYRMLGSVMDAEDIVQEAFLRWERGGNSGEEIRSLKSYLSTIVTRLCLDQLRSARVKREIYIGTWLPEPLPGNLYPENDLEENVVLTESLSFAFLILLETLTPQERAVFLLREVFDYDYVEIARIVEINEVNCRQLNKRTRQKLNERRPRFTPSMEQQQQVLNSFLEACQKGNMEGLLSLLNNEVTLYADSGGKVLAARNPIYGADKVARLLFGVVAKAPLDFQVKFREINGQLAIVGYSQNQPINVMLLEMKEGGITTIYNVVNPDKLKSI